MATYVLVGGAWLVLEAHSPQLRNQGHDAYPVTLSGLGERSHLASPEVDLETHITDAVNLIEFEDLRDVVLLGHSYAGIVVTGAADRIRERIAQLVYLDSGPVPDGPVRLADLGGVDGSGGLLDRRATWLTSRVAISTLRPWPRSPTGTPACTSPRGLRSIRYRA